MAKPRKPTEKPPTRKRPIEQYDHKGKQRKNNPPVGLVTEDETGGWARLARNLRTEIDLERIEANRGNVSLPFEPGEHRRVAVKIVTTAVSRA